MVIKIPFHQMKVIIISLFFRCDCTIGVTGTYCETIVHSCRPNTCHGGFCIAIGTSTVRCACPEDGFLRDRFCKVLDPCDSFPCASGSTCTSNRTEYSYTCKCPPGYFGTRCFFKINECQTMNVQCLNGGICIDRHLNFSCMCAPGFDGRFCEIDINECLESSGGNLCQQGSTCIDGIAGYSCKCTVGYAGKYCNETYSHCDQGPCQNGASCLDLTNQTVPSGGGGGGLGGIGGGLGGIGGGVTLNPDKFRCSCTDGFTGVFCELNIDDCVRNQCQVGGVSQINFLFNFGYIIINYSQELVMIFILY